MKKSLREKLKAIVLAALKERRQQLDENEGNK